MKVGIFDSGIGGITVLKTAIELLPQLEYIYYSDNLHVPYGTKPKEEVIGYVKDVVAFLVSEGAEAILIACNTATSVAVKELREIYDLPIIGMEPAVKLALDDNAEGKVLVTATPLSLKGEKYKNLVAHLDHKHRVDALPLPELVTFAETKNFDEEMLTTYFKEKLSTLNLDEYVGIVLGCTHFIYFKKYLEKILPKHIKIYDGNEGAVRHLKECIGAKESSKKVEPNIIFYYSGKKCETREILDSYLKLV
ncbi:MAG: glutamate racemase [Cellulosilyticum sp.]|nr:glutamate racemase [Cellulosilyticum sp.]MEE1071048.1 glutamate racemase [Cellulosilyticum sp.]